MLRMYHVPSVESCFPWSPQIFILLALEMRDPSKSVAMSLKYNVSAHGKVRHMHPSRYFTSSRLACSLFLEYLARFFSRAIESTQGIITVNDEGGQGSPINNKKRAREDGSPGPPRNRPKIEVKTTSTVTQGTWLHSVLRLFRSVKALYASLEARLMILARKLRWMP